MTVAAAPEALAGFLLALVRASAWLLVAPPFGTRMVPMPVKAGFAAALALFASPRLVAEGVPLELGPLLGAAFVQVGIGVALGFVVLLLFQALQAAGEIIDVVGGFTVQPAFDPLSGQQSSAFGRVHQVLGTTLLFAVGGHLLLVRGFLESFDAVGVGGFATADLSDLLVRDSAHLLLAALEMAAPLIGVLFLVEVAVGIMARLAPQMNVFIAAMPLKIVLTLALVGLALPLLPGVVSTLVERGVREGMALLGLGR